jgi:hypothetical protein
MRDIVCALGMTAVLMACVEAPPVAPTTDRVPAASPSPELPIADGEPAQAPLTTADLDRLDQLLTLGDDALKADHLLIPAGQSAYDYYTQALEIAPGHPAALAGRDKVVDRYLGRATDAVQRGQFDLASNLLERARFVNDAHEGIAVVERQIANFRNATRERVVIDGAALAARTPELARKLAVLGQKAKEPGVWVTITARSDPEGRWIYQQLRRAPGATRIRAELVIGGTVSVQFYRLAEAGSP